MMLATMLFAAEGAEVAKKVTEAVGGNTEVVMEWWKKISIIVVQVVVILGAVAALDPTNKVAKFNAKLIGIFTAIGFLDKDKKK